MPSHSMYFSFFFRSYVEMCITNISFFLKNNTPEHTQHHQVISQTIWVIHAFLAGWPTHTWDMVSPAHSHSNCQVVVTCLCTKGINLVFWVPFCSFSLAIPCLTYNACRWVFSPSDPHHVYLIVTGVTAHMLNAWICRMNCLVFICTNLFLFAIDCYLSYCLKAYQRLPTWSVSLLSIIIRDEIFLGTLLRIVPTQTPMNTFPEEELLGLHGSPASSRSSDFPKVLRPKTLYHHLFSPSATSPNITFLPGWC